MYRIHSALQMKPGFSLLKIPFHHFCIWSRFTLYPKSLPMIHLLGVPCGSARGQTVFQDWAMHVAGVSRVGGGLSLGSSHLRLTHRNPLLRRCSHTATPCQQPEGRQMWLKRTFSWWPPVTNVRLIQLAMGLWDCRPHMGPRIRRRRGL